MEHNKTPQDGLARDIQRSLSANIIGFFLDAGSEHDIDNDYREMALEAAGRFVNDPNTDNGDKNYLHIQLDTIAEDSDDDLQGEAKELIMSWADDETLAKIALDEHENEDIRISALRKITNKDLLLDIAADSEDEIVRQAAKLHIKSLK